MNNSNRRESELEKMLRDTPWYVILAPLGFGLLVLLAIICIAIFDRD